MSPSVWIVRSICPFIAGWKAVLKCDKVPNASYSFCQKPDRNLVSLSDIIAVDTPCNFTISSRYTRTSWSRVHVFLIAKKCAALVSLSTITHIAMFFLWVRANPSAKSIDTESHIHSGIYNSCRGLVGLWCSIFTHWNVRYFATQSAISCFMLLH